VAEPPKFSINLQHAEEEEKEDVFDEDKDKIEDY